MVGETTVNIGDAVRYRSNEWRLPTVRDMWRKVDATGIILRKAPMGKLLVGYQGFDKHTPSVEVLWSDNERDLLWQSELMVISEGR